MSEHYDLEEIQDAQACPYCGDEVEDHLSEWNDKETVKCVSCGEEYQVEPIYDFKGWKMNKKCERCGEWTEDGMMMCDCEGEE